MSIARYRTFAYHEVPFKVTIIVDSIYLSNGLLNVILFSLTRPYLLPHNPRAVNMVVVTEQRHTDADADIAFSGEANEGTSTSVRDWFARPQDESPTAYSFSEYERSVQGSGVPLDEKHESMRPLGW